MLTELNDFYYEGSAWLCRHCEGENQAPLHRAKAGCGTGPKIKSKAPKSMERAYAVWADPEHLVLTCPRCGITEPTGRS